MNQSRGMNNNNIVPITSLTDWSLIDQGHFGSVYKAKHTDFKVTLAVKKLKGYVPKDLKELISEAEKMASASANPYVIRLFGILEENRSGPPGIVMEFMEYGSLFTLMERVDTIPWALKFRIIYQVTLGMNWLHNLPTPLLHLDLKTRNVLLNEELHIKITDFGLSKFTSCHGADDCDGVGGTLEYMPPEAFQEGYKPSTSTDVYSFAILSAVVLRGENPYPVAKSALIRELVPRGQRPCLKELENKSSVKYINEVLELTKRCWDNDKFKRPPFSECCNKWERFFNSYSTCEVRRAVRHVQDKLDTSMIPGKTVDVSYKEDTASVNTKDMSEMVNRLTTMNISEEPPVLTESVPVHSSQNMQSQISRFHPETVQQSYPQGAMGHNCKPQSSYYPGPEPVTSFPNMQHPHARPHPETIRHGHMPGPMGYYSPQHYQGVPPGWPQCFPRHPYRPQVDFGVSQPFPSNTTTINITGSSNFQIGDNSIMNVTEGLNPYRNMMYRQPVYTHPTAMSPQPKQPMSHYNTAMSPQANQTIQERAMTVQPCKQKTADKSDEKSYTHPVQATPKEHSSGACSTQQVTGNSMSTTGKSTEKR